MKKGGNMSIVLIVALLLTVAIVIGLSVMTAKKNAEEAQRIKEMEVIRDQNAQELGDAMQGIKSDIEAGYEELDLQVE
ncbi:MAG: hypothetical protein K6E50_12080 [Lachnospiraceae bacterium]|nr:hypothetical protein [Lachnospiraceae bacterium]